MHDRSGDRRLGPIKNYHYDNDVQYALQLCHWLLKPIGMWSWVYNRASKLEQIVSIVLLATCFSFLFFVLIPSSQYIFFQETNVKARVKMIGPISFCFAATIKYCYLGVKGETFSRCIDHLERDWRTVEDPDHRSIMLKYASISRHLITLCSLFFYSGGLSYHTVMQFLSKDSRKNSTIKPLAYPCFSFLDVQSSPTYEIVFTTHCLCSIIMYSATVAAYSLAVVFVTHICSQIQIQINRLEVLVKQTKEASRPDPLAIIIRNHVNILRFSKDVEEGLREICLVEIIECTINMCLLEYYCMTDWHDSDIVGILTYVTLLTSFTFIIFIFCYISEVLSEQCSQIGSAAYEIDWYDLPAKKAYDLILLNAISLSPPKLTAGKIIDLSLDTFGVVVKTSFVYLNLLRTMTTCYSAFHDVQRTPVYQIVFTIHFTCGYVIYSVTVGACGLAALFATHIYGQIDIIVSRLDDLVVGKLTKGLLTENARLKNAIEHYGEF